MLRLYDVAQLKLLALNQLAGFYSIYGAFLAGAAFNSGHTTVFSVGDITKKQNKKKNHAVCTHRMPHYLGGVKWIIKW